MRHGLTWVVMAAALLSAMTGCSDYESGAKVKPTDPQTTASVVARTVGPCGTFNAGDGIEFIKPCADGKPSPAPKCQLGVDNANFAELSGSATEACVGYLVNGKKATAYVLGNDATFDTGRADIKPAARQGLVSIAGSLKQRFPKQEVLVRGHTDSQGNEQANKDLSTRRAMAVKQWLSTDGSIDPGRIRTTGMASQFPVSPERRPDGSADIEAQARNRRVEILILED